MPGGPGRWRRHLFLAARALGSFALGPLGLALAGPAAAAAGLAATLTGAGVLLAAASVVPLLSREVRDLPASPAGAAPGTVGSVAG